MLKPCIRFRIDFGPDEAIGPGKIALLEHIDRSGSISQAARDLGMSYRRGWQLAASLNGSFEEALITASPGGRRGGGAILTPLGHEVVKAYRAFESDVQKRAARHFMPLARHARKKARHSTKAAPVVRLNAR